MFRALALTICLALPLAGSGCAIVEVGMRNPVVGLETVAIAPFFNLSQERTVDGREFALDYYAELQKVPGFEVLPVGVTERAMIENGITLTGPHDAVRLAAILDVDAVVVGAVTDYDPYNPRIGLKVAWYSPRQFLFLPNEDPTVPFFNRSADASVKGPGRPKYSTARAQSPDDSDEWVSASFERAIAHSASEGHPTFIEEGDWETAASWANTQEILLADAGNVRGQTFGVEQSLLPEGASLLVPVSVDRFPSLPEPERLAEPIPAPPAEEQSQTQALPVSYQEAESTDLSPLARALFVDETLDVTTEVSRTTPRSAAGIIRAQATDTQATGPEPPVTFQPSPSAQPIGTNEPTPLPGTETPIQQPVTTAPPADDNPFNRHLLDESQPASPQNGREASRSGLADSVQSLPPRVAVAEPESPGQSGDSTSTTPVPPAAEADGAMPQSKTLAPVMQTPLFPVPQSEMNQWQAPQTQATRPALIYDEQVVVAPNEFEATEPLMAYVRLFDATDRRLIARLSDYLELTGQLRSGDLEAYMKRSEFFRKFTAHVMISEMLQLHGGEARRQLVLKPRKYR
jgi:hypothetical protein